MQRNSLSNLALESNIKEHLHTTKKNDFTSTLLKQRERSPSEFLKSKGWKTKINFNEYVTTIDVSLIISLFQ